MIFKSKTKELDHDLLDLEHDMDLVSMLHNAQTHDDVQHVIRITNNRMRVRRAANIASQSRRGPALRSSQK